MEPETLTADGTVFMVTAAEVPAFPQVPPVDLERAHQVPELVTVKDDPEVVVLVPVEDVCQ